MRGLGTPATHQYGRAPRRVVSAAGIFSGASQWRGIRGGRATGSPTWRGPRPVRSRSVTLAHETVHPRGAHKPVCWCRVQSSPSTLVRKIANLVPIGLTQFRSHSLALECYFAQPKWARSFPLRNDLAQALFNQCTEGRTVSRCDLSCFAQERIGNIERGLHLPYPWFYQYG